MWRDETLIPRVLEAEDTIFDIIMPWVKEESELKELQKKKQKKDCASAKKTAKQSNLSNFFTSSNKNTPGAGKASATSQ